MRFLNILTRLFITAVFLCSCVEVFPARFKPITPKETVKKMSPGWTLGNTLDAMPTEGSWGIPPVEEYVFDDIKKAGFKTVRIPVTWGTHVGPAPDYEIDPQWMDRVEEVVDWALRRGFYVVLNSHHDSRWLCEMAIDAETGRYVNDYENNIGRFEKIWEQVARRFSKKSEKLILEITNEPRVDKDDDDKFGLPKDPKNPEIKYDLTHEQMDDLNSRVLKIIRSSGGYNDKRLVMVCGLAYASEDILEILKLNIPDDKYIVLTVHYYIPWQFVSNWWGRTDWGRQNDKVAVHRVFNALYSELIEKGFPIVVGEWGTQARNDPLARWYYHDYIAKTAYKHGMSCILWDNGTEYFDRKNRIWKDEILKNVTVNAGLGIPNSFIFPVDNYFPANEEIKEDLNVKLELNGNRLINIYNGKKKLRRGRDYIYDAENSILKIKKEYLSKLLKPGKLGVNAVLKLDFSRGVDMPLNIIQYDLPKFPTRTVKVDRRKINAKSHLEMITIPVTFNGVKLARIGIVDKAERKPVIHSWTPYIKAVNNHYTYNFDCDRAGILLNKDLLNLLKADVLFTFEFWPEGVKVEMEALLEPPYVVFTVKDTN